MGQATKAAMQKEQTQKREGRLRQERKKIELQGSGPDSAESGIIGIHAHEVMHFLNALYSSLVNWTDNVSLCNGRFTPHSILEIEHALLLLHSYSVHGKEVCSSQRHDLGPVQRMWGVASLHLCWNKKRESTEE